MPRQGYRKYQAHIPQPIRIFWAPNYNAYAVQGVGNGGPAFTNDLNMFCQTTRWIPADKVWTVEADELQFLLDVLTRHFPTQKPTIDYKPADKATVVRTDNNKILAMFEAAGPEVSKKVYRMLVAKYHPDSGDEPDSEKCADITVGWNEIKNSLGWS